jgi:hypothetical protein
MPPGLIGEVNEALSGAFEVAFRRKAKRVSGVLPIGKSARHFRFRFSSRCDRRLCDACDDAPRSVVATSCPFPRSFPRPSPPLVRRRPTRCLARCSILLLSFTVHVSSPAVTPAVLVADTMPQTQLERVNCPFIVPLKFSFQSKQKLRRSTRASTARSSSSCSSTCTRSTSCTATSSRRTSCWTTTATSRSATLASARST